MITENELHNNKKTTYGKNNEMVSVKNNRGETFPILFDYILLKDVTLVSIYEGEYVVIHDEEYLYRRSTDLCFGKCVFIEDRNEIRNAKIGDLVFNKEFFVKSSVSHDLFFKDKIRRRGVDHNNKSFNESQENYAKYLLNVRKLVENSLCFVEKENKKNNGVISPQKCFEENCRDCVHLGSIIDTNLILCNHPYIPENVELKFAHCASKEEKRQIELNM